MKKFTILLLALFTLIIPATVAAQGGSTPDNADDSLNWCYPGQPWGDGRCVDDALTQWEHDWYWTCGWYWAHYEAGDIAMVPDWCAGGDSDADGTPDVLDICPYDPTDACWQADAGVTPGDGGAGGGGIAPGCYDATFNASQQDVWYYGPINTPGNYRYFPSTDGTCSGTPINLDGYMWVNTTATTEADVIAYCNDIVGSPVYTLAFNLMDEYELTPAVPSTYWECVRS